MIAALLLAGALSTTPVIAPPASNEYGFEGGSALQVNGTTYIATSKMVGDPYWVRMDLGLWSNQGGWHRVATLASSGTAETGTDQYAAVWAPQLAYGSGRWHLFFTAYHALPNNPNFDGVIAEETSTVPGPAGIAGPYANRRVVLPQGRYGMDGFYPYRVGNRWLGLYGFSTGSHWGVGTVSAGTLDGPWHQVASSPSVEAHFMENPIVEHPGAGFIATYDTDLNDKAAIGVMASSDGLHWHRLAPLTVTHDPAVKVRTSLGIVGNHLFYAARDKTGREAIYKVAVTTR